MATNVIPFPDLMNQRAHDPNAWRQKPEEIWTLQDRIAAARARIVEEQSKIDEYRKGGKVTRERYIVAIAVKEGWENFLTECEAEGQDSTLRHAGKVYAEMAGRA